MLRDFNPFSEEQSATEVIAAESILQVESTQQKAILRLESLQ